MTARETTKAIEAAIYRKYLGYRSGWGVLREVSIDDLVATGTVAGQRVTRRRRRAATAPTVRRIDFLLMRISRGSRPRYERIALEVKVSRADFKRDTDEKRRAWFSVADRFAYVAPVGLIAVDELPPGCGLLEFDANALFPEGQLKWKKVAPRKAEPPIPFDTQFFAYLFGRASRAEHALRGQQ